MKRLLIILIAAALLAGCSKPAKNDTTPPSTEADTQAVTEASTEATTAEATLPTEETTVSATEATTEETTVTTTEATTVTEAATAETTPEVTIDCRASDMLRLLNSDKIHVKFTEALTVDGENMYSSTIEYYVNGNKMVFIDDTVKIIIDGDKQYVFDTSDNSLIVDSYDSAHAGPIFGYDLWNYTFQYEEELENSVIEVLTVTQYDNVMTSKWYFYDDGTLLINEGNDDVGVMTAYSFEIISDDLSGMDMNPPEGFGNND